MLDIVKFKKGFLVLIVLLIIIIRWFCAATY